MREFYFEKLIREKLQDLEVPFNQDDWKDMEFLLDEVMEVEDQSQGTVPKQETAEEVSLSTPLLSDFDKEIAQKLNSISEPVPNDWELFASELDDGLFDQAIREKIDEVSYDQKPTDWVILEAKIDETPLDSIIRKTLLNYRMPFSAPDWLILSEILNRPFDQAIREKLSSLSFPVPAKDWQLMSNQLAQTPGIVTTIPWYANWKNYVSYASVAVMLFLSIGWGNYITNLWEGQVEYVEYPLYPFTPELTTIDQVEDLPVNQKINIMDGLAENQVNNTASLKTFEDKSSANNSPAFIEEVSNQIATTQAQEIIDVKPEAISKEDNEQVSFAIEHSDNSTEATALLMSVDDNKGQPMEITVEPLGSSLEETTIEFKLSSRGIHKIEPSWQRNIPEVRIGFFGGNTSSMVELSDPGELGYMGGLRLELMVNQEFSIVTGLNYNLRNITYEFQVFTPRRLDQTLQARLEMVELPILFRYNFPTQNRLNLYAQAGVVTAVSIVEDYRAIANTPPPFGSSQTRPSGSIDERKYNTYVGNIYAAAGFEYQLNSSLAFQIEPYFQMNMQKTKGVSALGLGFEKQIYTAGIGLGILYSLNKREKQ